MYSKFTPEFITTLKENEIFVFGSNLNGYHIAGAAKIACDKFGAVYGAPIGIQGNSYALPTLDENFKKLSIGQLRIHINNLYNFIETNTDKDFYITKVGCGIAGFNVSEIKQLFTKFCDLPNVYLPQEFVK